MTTNIIRCAVLLVIALSATQIAAKPNAYLRDDGTNFYVAIKAEPHLWNGRDAAGMQVATTDDVLKRVIAAVFLEGRLVATAVSASEKLCTESASRDLPFKDSSHQFVGAEHGELRPRVLAKGTVSERQDIPHLVT